MLYTKDKPNCDPDYEAGVRRDEYVEHVTEVMLEEMTLGEKLDALMETNIPDVVVYLVFYALPELVNSSDERTAALAMQVSEWAEQTIYEDTKRRAEHIVDNGNLSDWMAWRMGA